MGKSQKPSIIVVFFERFTCFSSNSKAGIQQFHLEILSANMHKLNVSQSKSVKVVHVVKDFP